jgi:hypothetical protein
MARKTIYYEAGIPATLIPVEFIGWTESPLGYGFNATIRLKRSAPGYSAGEIVRVPARSVVEKAGRRDYFIRVRPAELPVRTDSNTLVKPDY